MPYSFLATADVHLGWKLYNLPELEEDLRDAFSQLVDLALTRRVNFLVLAGDTFDHNRPTPDLIAFFNRMAAKARDGGVSIIGIAGDHDRPVNSCSWMTIGGCLPLESIPCFAGCDYSGISEATYRHLREKERRDQVEWIVLHGQEPRLFGHTEDKKRLDFSVFPVLEYYPNLKGIILGDIHGPVDHYLTDSSGRSVYLGYCGSLGVVKKSEANNKTGILYYDGKNISRIPFGLQRKFVKIDFTGDQPDKFDFSYYQELYKKETKKPVFLVEYDSNGSQFLSRLNPLYQLGFVRTEILRTVGGEVVNSAAYMRDELITAARIEQVLAGLCTDSEVKVLAQELLTPDANERAVLDRFKQKYSLLE